MEVAVPGDTPTPSASRFMGTRSRESFCASR